MRWIVGMVVAGAMLPGEVALAAPPSGSTAIAAEPATATEPAPEATSDPALERARQLYRRGEDRFATADYLGAIELWTEAFTTVPDTSDAARIKALLIYNIGTARERAFEITGDVAHLRQARVLMESYAASIPALIPEPSAADEERARITGRLNVIVARIEQWDRAQARAKKAARGGEGPDRATDERPRGTVLIGVGAGLLGLGVAGLAVMTGGLVMGRRANDIDDLEPGDIGGRRDRFDRGRAGNGMALGGGIVGGVLAVTGAALLGVGLARRGRARAQAWTPVVERGLAGVAVAGRF